MRVIDNSISGVIKDIIVLHEEEIELIDNKIAIFIYNGSTLVVNRGIIDSTGEEFIYGTRYRLMGTSISPKLLFGIYNNVIPILNISIDEFYNIGDMFESN